MHTHAHMHTGKEMHIWTANTGLGYWPSWVSWSPYGYSQACSYLSPRTSPSEEAEGISPQGLLLSEQLLGDLKLFPFFFP